MKCGVVVFPGSNCDHDSYHVLKHLYGQETHWIWHKDQVLEPFDLIVLPGGFSYGDYLRPGAIARFSPIMKAIIKYANAGGRVLGICNGFQILVESGLLPGALRRNASQKFICKYVHLRVESNQTPYTSRCEKNAVLKIPVAHADGGYFVEPEMLKALEDQDRIILRYSDAAGRSDATTNPNGSVGQIAAVANAEKNVLGMMPHPERCADPLWPDRDGRYIFDSLIHSS